MKPRTTLALASPLLIALTAISAGCKGDGQAAPAVPASSDPAGNDLVEGAVIAAVESSGGVRLNKVIHVDDYPEPVGHELHLIAYEPKAPSFEEAAKLWQKRGLKVTLNHFEVRKIDFLKRDHRVIAVEVVSDAEKAPYLKARQGR